ncbi:MAG: M23 family metallopeptidase, partial [Verrucomicrobia bacterium]|nr:M23 family metallopeptidase [Verrucomicrobiota bacterium]
LQLVVPAETNSGVLFLFQATNLDQLWSAPTLMLLTNAPVTDALQVPLTPEQRAFFYAIRRTNSSFEDYQAPDFPDEPSSPYALWTLGIPTNLVSGASYTADFLLVLSTNALADVSGTAQLSVVRRADGLPHPDAQVTPAQISFVQGACRTTVQVTASTSLTGYVVAVTLAGASAAPQSLAKAKAAPAAASSTFTLVAGFLFPNSPLVAADAFAVALAEVRAYVATLGWTSPLAPGELPKVTGTFGEWRGHRDAAGVSNANYHAGLDLVATGGTPVFAAREGMVTTIKRAKGVGRYINLDHGDGWYSRYLHLTDADPSPTLPFYVSRGALLGHVVKKTEMINSGDVQTWSEHFHFELRYAGPGAAGNTQPQPGIGRDPLREPVGSIGMFAVQQPPQELSKLWRVGVTPSNPADKVYNYKSPVFVEGNTNTAYVVLKIMQRENGSYLSPQTVRFTPEGPGPFAEFSTSNTTAITNLLPANSRLTARGFARYLHGYSYGTYDREEFYRYWFRWDVDGYAAAAIGPRKFTVDSTDYAGRHNLQTNKWGPEILSVVKVSLGDGHIYRVVVRAWLGEDAATAATDTVKGGWDTGADWYRYELPDGLHWVSGNAASTNCDESDPTFATKKLRTQFFEWIPPAGQTAPIQVTVRSRTVPAIAHQVQVSPDPNLYSHLSPCPPGYTSGVITGSSSLWTWTCTGSDGVPILHEEPKKDIIHE